MVTVVGIEDRNALVAMGQRTTRGAQSRFPGHVVAVPAGRAGSGDWGTRHLGLSPPIAGAEVSVTHDSELDPPGSAVMRAASSVPDISGILEELELRLSRFSWDDSSDNTQARTTSARPDFRQRSAVAVEVQSVLYEHAAEGWNHRECHRLVRGIMAREPMPIAMALPQLFAEGRVGELTWEELIALAEWISHRSVDRSVRDGFALLVAVPALLGGDPAGVRQGPLAWCGSDNLLLARIGFLSLTGLLRHGHAQTVVEPSVLVELCCARGASAHAETAAAVGWTLRELFTVAPVVTRSLVERNIGLLSRQTLRTAVERLPAGLRCRYTARWRQMRKLAGGSAVSQAGPEPCPLVGSLEKPSGR